MLVVSRPNCVLDRQPTPTQLGHARAVEQHAIFVRALRAEGAQVLQLPFIRGSHESVFVRDSALLRADATGLHLLPATPRFAQRAMEPALRVQQLARPGSSVAAPSPFALEGGDVVMTANHVAIMGYGTRTELQSATHLERFLGCEVVPVHLRDDSLFHLDSALTALSSGAIVLCEEAFDAPSLRAIAGLSCPHLVTIPRAEAIASALDVVEVKRTIITGTRSDWMDELWRSLGFHVHYSPLEQFQLAGGSAACLVAKVHDLAEPASAAA